MLIKNAEIFQVGRWNGMDFTSTDLDAIASSFATLDLKGRIPLKMGHDGPDVRDDDSQPALGWIMAVRRDGSKLLADISVTSAKLATAIKDGSFKFVSVELLKNVQAATRQIPWVLDAVALLGATQPAVGTLKSLQDSLQPAQMSARAPLTFEARASFSMAQPVDVAVLRAEHAREITRVRVDAQIESAIKCQEVLPTARELFRRVFTGDAYTTENWVAFARTQPKPDLAPKRRVVGEAPASGADDPTVPAGEQLNRLTDEYVEQQRVKFGRVPSWDQAAITVQRAHPALVARWHEEQQQR